MEIDIEKLQKICLDFFRLAGMGFSLWDENRNNIFSYPQAHAPFCEAVRNAGLGHKCLKCDAVGLQEVDRTKKPHIYTCHMGLTEAIVPILQDEEIVGYLMMGQIVEDKNRSHIESCIKNVAKSDELYELLESKLCENINTTHDRINYCVNILKVMIDYMNLSYVFQKSNESVYTKAKKYITANMSKPILPKDICSHIGVSANTLYKTVKTRKGISPTQLIRNMKIAEAKRLLSTSDMSISHIAESVGIPDVNYFIRVFKRKIGVSPLKFRKGLK